MDSTRHGRATPPSSRRSISWRRLLAVVLAVILVVSLVLLIRDLIDRSRARVSYREAEELAGIPSLPAVTPVPTPAATPTPSDTPAPSDTPTPSAGPTPSAEPNLPATPSKPPADQRDESTGDPLLDALRGVSIVPLQALNPDVVGWIIIPDTVVSYPLLRGDTNSEYLRTTWRKERNTAGSIFIECQNRADFSDFNTIIYGHRMGDGSMFGCLGEYAKRSWWSAHPSFYIVADGTVRRYDVFAVRQVETTDHVYRLGLNEEADRTQWLERCVEKTELNTGIVPTAEDSIVTLSTCTRNDLSKRWVVQGVLAAETPLDGGAPGR